MKTVPLLTLLSLAVNAPAVVTLTDPGQEVFDFTADAAELSGLAWLTGATYHAISDAANQRQVYELHIGLNPANGRITEASLAQPLTLAAGYDLEGIAWSRSRGAWFVADEGQHPNGGFLREHTLPDGNLIQTLEIPTPLENDRSNFSLESCTWRAGALWTANEEALAQESALSTAASGSLVRLQKLDHQLNPAGQWAYQTDSYGFDSSLTTAERSGVADLLALPDGTLLVLERALGIGFLPSFRNRIYLVGFTGATDVSGVADLDDATFTPVTKTLLWEKNLGSVTTRNFEGIALGPALPLISSTSYSVLLVADNGGGTQQHLYALIVNGVAAPAPIAQWRQGWWGTTAATGPAADEADPDGDGVPNLLEYAFGGNPRISARAPLPQPGTAGGNLALTFNRNLTHTDLTHTVQAADSLDGSWLDLAESVVGGAMTALLSGVVVTETGTGATRSVEVSDPAQAGDPAPPRRFMRVKVSYPVADQDL
jgi:hypothetical protein